MTTTLVFGASGYLGSHLAPALAAKGYSVRATARNLEVINNRNWQNVECCFADALMPESLDTVLKGVNIAYYLIHSMSDGPNFSELEQQCARNFAKSARNHGVSLIIYMGALMPPNTHSKHLLARNKTGQILRAHGLIVTEVQAGIIVGPGSAAYEVIRDLVRALPVMVTPKWVHTKSPPIALANLLTYLTEIPSISQLHGLLLPAAGPEQLSYAELLLQYAAIARYHPKIIPVPFMTPKLSSYWLKLITAVPYNLARALVDGLSHNLVADDKLLRQAIPQTLLTYREAVKRAIEDEQNLQVYTRWVEGAIQFRNFQTDTSYYAKKCTTEHVGSISLETLWERLTSIGGNNGYPALNWLWNIRAWIDWALGGPGRNKGRARKKIRQGDTIDSWQVIAFEKNVSFSLLMRMRAPGVGVLEFSCYQEAHGTRLKIAAFWHPKNILGLIYWYSLLPIHKYLFHRTVINLLRPEA